MTDYILEFANGGMFEMIGQPPLNIEELGKSRWLTYRLPSGAKIHFNIAQIQCIREEANP